MGEATTTRVERTLNPIDDKPRAVWTDLWCLPHESTFCRLQKFAWANVAGANDIGRDVFGKRPISDFNGSSRELFFGDWISSCVVNAPAGLTLQEGLAANYGQHWMGLLASDYDLRYCETCLFEGFHSLLFQIEGLVKCPRHGTALRSTCPCCNRATIGLSLEPRFFEKPFCCPQCQHPFAGTFDPRRWFLVPSQRQDIADKLDPLAAWLHRLARYRGGRYATPLAQLSLAGEFAGESDALVAFDIARRLIPLALPADHCASARRPLRIVPFECKPAASPILKLSEHILRKESCFRAIQNHLLQTYLKPHRQCLQHAQRGITVESYFRGDLLLLQEPGLCTVAAGFVRWQRRFWMDAQYDRKWYLKGAPENVRDFSAPTAWFGQDLLSQFYSCVATAYVAELLLRAQSPDEREQARVYRYWTTLDSYTMGGRDRGALWLLESQKEANIDTAPWLVCGDPSILKLGESLGFDCRAASRHSQPSRTRSRATRDATPTSILPGREVWSDRFVLPYESALSVLLKYVNSNPGADRQWNELCSGGLLWGRGPRRPLARIACADAIARGTLRYYAHRWRCGLATATRLRICPACAALGYHSVFFQLQDLRVCPIHGVALQERCPFCEKPTPPYLPTTTSLLRHLKCRKCHENLLTLARSENVARSADLCARIQIKLTPLAQWIEATERTHRLDPTLWSRRPIAELAPLRPLPFVRRKDFIR